MFAKKAALAAVDNSKLRRVHIVEFPQSLFLGLLRTTAGGSRSLPAPAEHGPLRALPIGIALLFSSLLPNATYRRSRPRPGNTWVPSSRTAVSLSGSRP